MKPKAVGLGSHPSLSCADPGERRPGRPQEWEVCELRLLGRQSHRTLDWCAVQALDPCPGTQGDTEAQSKGA